MSSLLYNHIEMLIADQLKNWETARVNYANLSKVLTRELKFGDNIRIKIQYNPERMRSSTAVRDPKTVERKSCFLCRDNRPPQQMGIEYRNDYIILINPYPIFDKHLTLPSLSHSPQLIAGRFTDMLELTKQLSEYSLFYNGPNCGASAPDHFHFQAGNKGFMPIEDEFQKAEKELLSSLKGCNTYALNHGFRKVLVLCGSDSLKLTMLFNHIMRIFSSYLPSDPEPMINIISLWQDEEWSIFVFPRQKHRPDQYFLSAKEQILLSPASVDFGGVLITPRQEDYEKLNKETIKDIFEQLSLEDKIWEAIKNELRD